MMEMMSQQNQDFDNQESIIRFCKDCFSTLQITFVCERKNCGFEMIIQGNGQQENLVSKIGSTNVQKLVINKDFCQDPTMPRERIMCPKCKFDEAIFLVTQDAEDTKIELVYICCNRACGYSWKKEVLE